MCCLLLKCVTQNLLSYCRTIVIHGAPPTLAAVVAKIVAQATSASAAPAIQNVFRSVALPMLAPLCSVSHLSLCLVSFADIMCIYHGTHWHVCPRVNMCTVFPFGAVCIELGTHALTKDV